MTIGQTYQTLLDKANLYFKTRWTGFVLSLLLFAVRIIITEGFYIVCYALAIYLLSLFLKFLTPLMGNVEDEDYDNPVLPIHDKDEFKPFIRKLPEFRFWKLGVYGSTFSIICTFIPVLDVPVYWPILVFYFLILLAITMKKQISHMFKHGYLPFSIGKTSYS